MKVPHKQGIKVPHKGSGFPRFHRMVPHLKVPGSIEVPLRGSTLMLKEGKKSYEDIKV